MHTPSRAAKRTTDTKSYSTRRVLVVDPARFAAEMAAKGAFTDDEIAALLETDRGTVRRIRIRESLPSNGFLAACVDVNIDPQKFLTVERRDIRATTKRAA